MYLGIIEFIVFMFILTIILFIVASLQKWWHDKHFKLGDGDVPKSEKSPMFNFFNKKDKD